MNAFGPNIPERKHAFLLEWEEGFFLPCLVNRVLLFGTK